MFERFTGRARRAIVSAQEEARNLQHNYIGTEHILLGVLSEGQGLGARVLSQFGMTLEDGRQEVIAIVGAGKAKPTGHIPFTPRAKKVLELALREALALHHNYIGTEHILLGLIRESDGVAAKILQGHADVAQFRAAVLDLLGTQVAVGAPQSRSWLRRVSAVLGRPGAAGLPGEEGEGGEGEEQSVLSATPATDVTLSTAARLAGADPVGSHHLLLAALTDANSAAARVLASLGVDLAQAKDALHNADITGTSDELPEDAGRRQMNIKVSDELVTIVATDEILVKSANAALKALSERLAPASAAGTEGSGGQGEPAGQPAPAGQPGSGTPGGVIRGADLSGVQAASLAKAWSALHEAFSAIAAGADAAAQAQAVQAQAGRAEAGQRAGAAASGGEATGDEGSPAGAAGQ
jgi:ATP-dependent Clp protease ATP-binding subunit ClpC